VTTGQKLAAGLLAVVVTGTLLAGRIAPRGSAHQFRDRILAPPSREFLLGTDGLGRDRFARLLYGARISLGLAPAAAALATTLSALTGLLLAAGGQRLQALLAAITDLWMALPWMFVLVLGRAVLPLNVSPLASVTLTFFLLGLLGWPATARVVAARVQQLTQAGFVLQARACGEPTRLILLHHLLPNLRPVLWAQFWILVPVFILAEANLSALGLGVAEPVPSLGNLLRELAEDYLAASQWWVWAPALLLVLVTCCFHFLLPAGEVER